MENTTIQEQKESNLLPALNLIVGAIQIISGFAIALVVVPKLLATYQEFGAEMNAVVVYIFPGTSILLGVLNIFIAIRVLKSTGENKLNNKTNAAILLLMSVLIALVVTAISIFTFVLPLYNLSTNI